MTRTCPRCGAATRTILRCPGCKREMCHRCGRVVPVVVPKMPAAVGLRCGECAGIVKEGVIATTE